MRGSDLLAGACRFAVTLAVSFTIRIVLATSARFLFARGGHVEGREGRSTARICKVYVISVDLNSPALVLQRDVANFLLF
jgi:hypothetical protein